MGRNILFKSILKKSFLLAAARRSEAKPRKTEYNIEKENSTNENDFSGNEIPDLNSLKLFEFESKANRDINSNSNDNDEESIQGKVKLIGNSEWCECSKQCKPWKTNAKSLCWQERNDIPEQYLEGYCFLMKFIHLRFSRDSWQCPILVKMQGKG